MFGGADTDSVSNLLCRHQARGLQLVDHPGKGLRVPARNYLVQVHLPDAWMTVHGFKDGLESLIVGLVLKCFREPLFMDFC